MKVCVVEKETDLALHQSKYNSGVIHQGIYYPTGSKRARLCVSGAEMMYDFCGENRIPHEKTGKLIVAVKPEELPRLDALLQRGIANNVKGLEMVDSRRISQIEPAIEGIRGIWSPNTGITDYRAVALKYADHIRDMGGVIKLGYCASVFRRFDQSHVEINSDIVARNVITCSGLFSDIVSRSAGGAVLPRIVPVRGDFLYMKTDAARGKVRGLVYPVPNPQLPFLGVHFTKLVDGGVKLGPNAVLALKREGYLRTDFDAAEAWEILRFSGTHEMIKKHFNDGVLQLARSLSSRLYVRALQEYMPSLTVDEV